MLISPAVHTRPFGNPLPGTDINLPAAADTGPDGLSVGGLVQAFGEVLDKVAPTTAALTLNEPISLVCLLECSVNTKIRQRGV